MSTSSFDLSYATEFFGNLLGLENLSVCPLPGAGLPGEEQPRALGPLRVCRWSFNAAPASGASLPCRSEC